MQEKKKEKEEKKSLTPRLSESRGPFASTIFPNFATLSRVLSFPSFGCELRFVNNIKF